jgi:hypothetical protein
VGGTRVRFVNAGHFLIGDYIASAPPLGWAARDRTIHRRRPNNVPPRHRPLRSPDRFLLVLSNGVEGTRHVGIPCAYPGQARKQNVTPPQQMPQR